MGQSFYFRNSSACKEHSHYGHVNLSSVPETIDSDLNCRLCWSHHHLHPHHHLVMRFCASSTDQILSNPSCSNHQQEDNTSTTMYHVPPAFFHRAHTRTSWRLWRLKNQESVCVKRMWARLVQKVQVQHAFTSYAMLLNLLFCLQSNCFRSSKSFSNLLSQVVKIKPCWICVEIGKFQKDVFHMSW